MSHARCADKGDSVNFPEGPLEPDLPAWAAIEEESVWTDSGEPLLRYVVHVVHNPFADRAYRLDEKMFAGYPQLLITNVEDEDQWEGEMAWSDGAPTFP